MDRIAYFPRQINLLLTSIMGWGFFCLIKKKKHFLLRRLDSGKDLLVLHLGGLLLQSDLSISSARKADMLYYQAPFSAVTYSLECYSSG